MNINTKTLEEIGLTKSEINVYLALLDLGSSSTGKIVNKSKAASSKIYEILDKLIQKGLVSYIIKSGIKHFEAAPPKRLMDYLEDKEKKLYQQKEEIKNLVPELELKRQLSKYKSEATIFKGIKGAKTAFDDILNVMKKGEEYYVLGATHPDSAFSRFIKYYHQKRSKKGIKVKLLFSESGKSWAENIKDLPHTEIKFASPQLFTSSFVLMYKNKTLITVSTNKDITLFQIDNKEVTESFKSQFELLWNQKIYTYEGQESVEKAYKQILDCAKKEDNTIIFAAKPKDIKASDYNLKWIKDMNKIVKSRAIYYGDNQVNKKRTKEFENCGCKTKIIPTEQILPISTVISGDNVLNTVWTKNPSAFIINDKIVAESFRKNFELLWNQDTTILKGVDAVEQIFDDILNYDHCDFIAAKGYFIDKRPEYTKKWEKKAQKRGFTMRNIVDSGTKGHTITKFSFAKTKYTLPKEFAELSVFWIYGDKVVISNWMEKEPFVIIIENKKLHQMYKQQFELLWKKKAI